MWTKTGGVTLSAQDVRAHGEVTRDKNTLQADDEGETPERVRRNSGAEETPDSLRKF